MKNLKTAAHSKETSSTIPAISTQPPERPLPERPKAKFFYTNYGKMIITAILMFLVFLVAAVIVVQTEKYKQRAQSQPSPAPTPTASERCEEGFAPLYEGGVFGGCVVNTTNWKTYRNEEYEFKFKYPPQVNLQEAPSSYLLHLVLDKKDGVKENFPIIDLSVSEFSGDFTNWATNSYYEQCPTSFKSCTSFSLGNTNLYSLEFESLNRNFASINTFIEDNNLVFNFSLSARRTNEPFNDEELSTYNQILSTFESLSDISDWKTYNNQEYSFKFKYPPSWPQSTEKEISSNSGPLYTEITFTKMLTIHARDERHNTPYTLRELPNLTFITSNTTVEDVSTDNYSAYKLTQPSGEVRVEISESLTSIKIVRFYFNPSQGIGMNTFDQILSTFEFFDQDSVLRTVKLYYHDSKLDPNLNNCEANNFIEKPLPTTNTPIKDTVNLLIDSGLLSNPPQFQLQSINLKDKTLYLEFPWIPSYTTGGSCHIGILTSQIIDTAMQFPEVDKVIFEPDVFQP